MIKLEVLQGAERGQTIESNDERITVGRLSSATVVLNDAHLSGEHGVIFRDQGQYIYRDLHSTNGSMVLRQSKRIVLDGVHKQECVIYDGDQLLLGDATSPVALLCSISDEAVSGSRTERIIVTRRLNELSAVESKVEKGPEVSTLYRALKLLNGRLELNDALEAFATAVFEVVPAATHVTVLLRDSNEEERFVPMLVRARDGSAEPNAVMMSRTILSRVLADQAAVLAANAADEFGSAESIMGANIHSTAGIPLRRGEQIIGVLQADNRAGSGMFAEHDFERLMVLGEQAGLAIDNARLYSALKIAQEQVQGENTYLRARQRHMSFDRIIGNAPPMRAIFKQLERVIDTRATVCIGGETGTGKELIATAIHNQGRRREKMFVAQNCAALPETLLESELFGHLKGAFTGADQQKKGLFEIADGGTLFLDEIGEMPATLQAKLLRVLQEGEIRPVGAARSKRVDVRIICATNRNLQQEVEAGRFRQDLFYRIMVFPIELPPLRDRPEDIAALVQHFMQRYAAEMRKAVEGISQEALNQLRSYRWPGNIRELENEVQRLVIQIDENGIVQPEHLSPQIRRHEGMLAKVVPRKGSLKEMMESVEKHLLVEALNAHNQNKTKTAASLGITREGLHKKLTKFGL